jgi:hypothetical protein
MSKKKQTSRINFRANSTAKAEWTPPPRVNSPPTHARTSDDAPSLESSWPDPGNITVSHPSTSFWMFTTLCGLLYQHHIVTIVDTTSTPAHPPPLLKPQQKGRSHRFIGASNTTGRDQPVIRGRVYISEDLPTTLPGTLRWLRAWVRATPHRLTMNTTNDQKACSAYSVRYGVHSHRSSQSG